MFSRVILRRNDPASGRSSPDDIENQPLSPRGDAPDSPEMTERQGGFSRLGIRRPSVPSRFRFSSSTQATTANGTEWPGPRTARASRSNTHPMPRPSSSHYPEEEDDEDLMRQPGPRDSTLPSRYSIIVDLPSTRLHLPMLQRTWTSGSNGPPTSRPLPPHEIHPALRDSPDEVCRPTGPAVPTVTVTEPAPVARPTGTEAGQLFGEIGRPRGGSGGYHGPDPAESSLADLAGDGRRRRDRRDRSGSDRSRRHRHRRHRDRLEVPGSSQGGSSEGSERRRRRRRIRDVEDGSDDSDRPHPKHFLFCFPWIKSRKVRSQILQCFVSGTFLVSLLAVCKYTPTRRRCTGTQAILTKLTTQHRPGPVPDQEHQQQRVHGPAHPHHPLRHHLLLSGPHPPVPAHPAAQALLGRGAPRRAEADVRARRVRHPAAADPRRARARRGGRGHRERDDKDEPARLRAVEGERGEYKPDPPPQSVYMCICLAESC